MRAGLGEFAPDSAYGKTALVSVAYDSGPGCAGTRIGPSHPGDGSTVTCHGAGTPYTSADNPASASPDCGHTYTSSSAGQPGGAFQATATIAWDITWRKPGVQRGPAAVVHTAVAAFRVAESQALNTSGGT